jgi:hypothetical protein
MMGQVNTHIRQSTLSEVTCCWGRDRVPGLAPFVDHTGALIKGAHVAFNLADKALATSLMVAVTSFQADDGHGAMPAAEFDGAPEALLHK